ncbi:hypothetical protein ACB098_11G101400 [Castanea mollissima]
MKLMFHLLLPLCVHWIAEEMTISVLVDVITNALCPGESTCTYKARTCTQAIYLNGFKQTEGQLADEHGRKPLLLLTIFTSIFPFAILAWNHQGSIFCIAIAYSADVVEENKRAAAFSWITGLCAASHVLGNFLAFFSQKTLLIFCPVYMQLFLVETIKLAPKRDQDSACLTTPIKIIQKRYNAMKDAATIVMSSPTLRGISLVSFFFELGKSGINCVLMYYLKAAFGFDKNEFSEILMLVGFGSIISQMLVLPLINPLVGEKVILCIGILASIAYVPFMGATFKVVVVLTYAIISRASSSNDQGKAQGFVARVEPLSSLLSPLIMSPLTSWFLSSNAPFISTISLCFACLLEPGAPSSNNSKDDIESPLLSES